MTVIDNVFCLQIDAIHRPEPVSIITLDCSENMGSYQSPVTAVRQEDYIGHEIKINKEDLG